MHARRGAQPLLKIDRAQVQWVGLFAGPLLAAAAYALLPESYLSGGERVAFSRAGRATAAIAVWMATWWLSEAIPVYATAFLPLFALPLSGAATIRAAASPFAHELIFLFLGGFVIALAMERWGLHRRTALVALRAVGSTPRRMVLGFMGITAGLSMWVSNTATTIMMLPIALSVISLVEAEADAGEQFAPCLLLGIAYAASIGGIGTLIGTPPNLFMASFAKNELGIEIGFARWMAVGLPLVAVFLPLTWWLLTRILLPVGARQIEGAAAHTREALAELGPMTRGERITLVVAGLTAAAWVTRPLLVGLRLGGTMPLSGLTDTGIAIGAALLLFCLPVRAGERVFVMDWPTAARLPWGLLILFGGGLSLAAAIRANGVGEWIAHQVDALAAFPPLLLVACLVAVVIFLTELTSNTATTATLVPILAGLAPGLGLPPLLLVVPAAVAASCAFMLPVATPPNAIVFGSDRVGVSQMARTGFWLNLLGIALITALAYSLVIPLLAG